MYKFSFQAKFPSLSLSLSRFTCNEIVKFPPNSVVEDRC